MIKVLLTGGSGYVGGNFLLWAEHQRSIELVSCYSSNRIDSPHSFPLDITNKMEVNDAITQIRPDVIIHLAAVTNSNFCANNKDAARLINIEGTRNLVSAAHKIGARLLFISTDLVHSGVISRSTEEEVPAPSCFYGQTKFEAEKVIQKSGIDSVIVRTSLIYGLSKTKKSTFFDNLLFNLREGTQTKLFIDEYRTPIYIENFFQILLELATNINISGLYNISGNERVSRYELGLELARALSMPSNLLVPVSVDSFEFYDKKPKDTSLDNRRIRRLIKSDIFSITESMNLIAEQILKEMQHDKRLNSEHQKRGGEP